MFTRRTNVALAAVLLAALPAVGQGVMLPTDTKQSPVGLKSHRVQIAIDNHVADTRVEQVFVNTAASGLEVDYLFPLPKDAVLSDFTLDINGHKLKGSIADKSEARQQYMRIVSQTGNAGLLEYMDRGLMRVSLGKIEPNVEQKVTIRYSQVLPAERGLYRYELPLRVGAAAPTVVGGDFTVGVSLKSPVDLATIYSPSHTVRIKRPNAREASFGFEKDHARLDRDFQLFYSVTDKEFGLNLLAHRADAKQPGTFLCLISPKSSINQQKLIKRDVVFVLDISGSMRGQKLAQAKNAMKYSVNRLNEGDRFTLIEFDSSVYTYSEALLEATPDNIAKALAHIEAIREKGGTNINDALMKALSFPRTEGRPFQIFFLTDGLPTSGERNASKIAENVRAKAAGVRIFSFGVGNDVNTALIDGLATDTAGASDYVKPEDDIEVSVSRLYSKASRPVLADLKLAIEGSNAKITEIYPKKLPDMFAGSQIVVVGRYEGAGTVKLTLTGNAGDRIETFSYEATLPEKDATHGFVEPLWAQRKIGHILDALRKGHSDELRDEAVRLSKKYGIPTPYTSFAATGAPDPGGVAFAGQRGRVGSSNLAGQGNGVRGPEFKRETDNSVAPGRVVDSGKPSQDATAPMSIPPTLVRPHQAGVAGPVAPPPDNAAGRATAVLDDLARRQAEVDRKTNHVTNADALSREKQLVVEVQALRNLQAASGKDAVEVAGYLKKLREGEAAEATGATDVRQVGDRSFFRYGSLWVDEKFAADLEVTKIKFGSDAYFKLLAAKPELAEVFQLGNALVLVTADGKAVAIGADGVESLDDTALAALFVAAKVKPADNKPAEHTPAVNTDTKKP